MLTGFYLSHQIRSHRSGKGWLSRTE